MTYTEGSSLLLLLLESGQGTLLKNRKGSIFRDLSMEP
jgi:hypothetical protein